MKKSVRIAKRAFDLLASGLGLTLTLPFWPLIAAAIYLDSPGPIFYKQRRAGRLLGRDPTSQHGFLFEEFDMYKFRTMRPDAEAMTGAVIATALTAAGLLGDMGNLPRVAFRVCHHSPTMIPD